MDCAGAQLEQLVKKNNPRKQNINCRRSKKKHVPVLTFSGNSRKCACDKQTRTSL